MGRTRTAAASRPRKPRAVGLSRALIVAQTLRYLRAHPTEPFTLARAGAAVGATSMAIYRHFNDAADLADAIVETVLGEVAHAVPQDADWRMQVRAWMTGLYGRLVETPQCVSMLTTANGLSPAWLRTAAVLRRSLALGGLEGAALSEGVFWVSMAMTGFARQTLTSPMAMQIEGTVAAGLRLDPAEAAELAPFIADVSRIYANALDIMVERTLASVDVLRGRGP
jgi:AcrR family transcriptional regulator